MGGNGYYPNPYGSMKDHRPQGAVRSSVYPFQAYVKKKAAKKRGKAPYKKTSGQQYMKPVATASVSGAKTARVSTPMTVADRCLVDYTASILDPFNGPEACVPVWPSPPSMKIRARSRGTLVVGTTGTGMITTSLQPGNDASGTGAQICHSDNTFNVNSIQTSGTGVVQINTNGPFSDGQFGQQDTDLSFRPISLGLRVRYTGTEENRGGSMAAAYSPHHEDLDNAAVGTLLSFDNGQQFPVTREWVTLVWMPIRHTEVEYFRDQFGTVAENHILGMLITGALNDTYDFEVAYNYEVIGRDARAKTVSVSNSKAFSVMSHLEGLGSTVLQSFTKKASGPAGWKFAESVVKGVLYGYSPSIFGYI